MGILLTSTLCFSQSSYPSKLVVDGDTLVCITVDQLRKLNTLLMDRLEYRELNDSLYVQIGIYRDLVNRLEEQVSTQHLIIDNLTQQTAIQDTVIRGIREENDRLTQRVGRQERVIKYGGAGAGILLIILLLL